MELILAGFQKRLFRFGTIANFFQGFIRCGIMLLEAAGDWLLHVARKVSLPTASKLGPVIFMSASLPENEPVGVYVLNEIDMPMVFSYGASMTENSPLFVR